MSRGEPLKPKITKAHRVKSVVHFAVPSRSENLMKYENIMNYKQYEEYFNQNGDKIEILEYHTRRIINWVKYAYDSNGQLDEITRHTGTGYNKSKFIPIITKAQRAINVLSETVKPAIESGIDKSNIRSVFYKNGKIKQRTFFREDSTYREQIGYKGECITEHSLFNERSKLYEHSSYLTSGELISQIKYEYDIFDNVISIYSKAGGILSHTKYEREYDNSRNLIRFKEIKNNYINCDIRFIYDERNNLIEDIDIFKEIYKSWNTDLEWNTINTVGYNNKYFYNEKNLLEKQEMYLGANLIMTHEFIYQFWSDELK
jgi:hypothetical protein